MTTATQEGAEVVGRNPRRDAAMDALVNKRNEEEIPVFDEEDEIPAAPVKWDAELGMYVTTIKVDGEEQVVPFSDVVNSAQKVKASGKRFEEAAMMKQQAEELRAEAERIRQERRDNPPPEEDEDEDDEDLKEVIKQYHKALYDDNEEEAIELLQRIRGRNKATQSVDVEATREMVREELRQEQQRQREESYSRELSAAQRRFEEEYADIAKDEVLRGIANQKTVEIMNAEPDLTPWEIISRASEQTREWVGSRTGSRQERKMSADAQPSSSSVTSTSNKGDDQPLTRSDIIAELKQARHQKV